MRRPRTTWPATVRVGVLVLAAAAAVVVASVATGVLGTGDESPARAALADPAEFAERIDNPATYLINVHTPYEGELEGTDAFIPVLGRALLTGYRDEAPDEVGRLVVAVGLGQGGEAG